MVNHWICYHTGKPFVPNLEKFGFVYIITNTKTTKAYVGCKQYFSMGKKKRKHKWEIYTGSSKYLNEDIEKIGKKHFTFEVIAEYKNKRSLRYYEMYYQVKWNVLTATLKDSDEQAFYNGYVGGKFYPPIENFEDPEWKRKNYEHLMKHNKSTAGKKHHFYKGKTEFYLDGKRMVVDCLGEWARENGYDRGNLGQVARTTRDGFYIHSVQGKARKFTCKGPLGTVTKVKYLGKEVKDVSQESNV
tara:strand:- start:220 stop:951 length:732 start_codon:yes stop_codon:yes gene_type:complete